MAILQSILATASTSPLITLTAVILTFLLTRCVYRIYLHPISHIPGPLLPKCTSLWLHYHAYIGDECTQIHALHLRYGPLVRVAPNDIDISDGDAVAPIYSEKGGFPKLDYYANFDIDGHNTIFSTTDSAKRAVRAKAVAPMFSTASIRANAEPLYACVDTMVARMEYEAATGRPVNVLNLGRSLAVDVVSTHLFSHNYNGTEEKTPRLSVSAFVDAFVAVGRFFYLPVAVFDWLMYAIDKTLPQEHTHRSMEIVEKYVDGLVAASRPDATGSYPSRLLAAGISFSETKSQCKDLIFAGRSSLVLVCRLSFLGGRRGGAGFAFFLSRFLAALSGADADEVLLPCRRIETWLISVGSGLFRRDLRE